MDREEMVRRWAETKLPTTLRSFKVNLKPSQLPWVTPAKSWARRPFSLLLTGKTGRGKTFFASFMLKAAVFYNYRISPEYFKGCDLDAQLLSAMLHSNYGDRSLVNRLKETELLCIDDIGQETIDQKTGRATDRIRRQYQEILDYRLEENLPTLLTSNFDINGLANFFMDVDGIGRMGSRLQLFEQWDFTGEDYRKETIN